MQIVVIIFPQEHYTNHLSVQNAFSQRLGEWDFNFFQMLANNLLHEFELGVWKAVFIHLIRILHSLGATAIDKFNERCVLSII